MTLPSPVQPLSPRVRRAPGIELTTQQAALLQQAFTHYTEIFAEQSFHSGYSGASVYLVSCDPDAPVVVKFAHPFDLQREVAAYYEFVEKAAPQNTARLRGELIASEDGQLGVIVYSFAGGNLHTHARSLLNFYQTQPGPATAKVFDHLFGSYGRQWWASNELRRIVVAEEYDRLLPVQATFVVAETPSAAQSPVQSLRAGQSSSLALRALHPGQVVQLEGFRVSKVQGNQLTLHADPPGGERAAPLRMRLRLAQAATYRPGDQLPTQPAVVQATRLQALALSAQEVVPTFNLEDEHFTVDGVYYINPLRQLAAALDLTQDARVSIVHGDLNLQNILVDPASGFAWLIDFSETHRGPTLFDLQRMEVQLVTKLLPASLPPAAQGGTLLASLFDALHTPTPSLVCPVPALQEPYTVLVTLREWARQFLVDDRQWDEYYRGLMIALLGALKFEELDALARRLALIGAAKAGALIGRPLAALVEPAPGQPPYKGLQAFTTADAELFFGREELIGAIVPLLPAQPFLAIVGASGSGKSSLVRAGLVAALQSQPATESAPWQITVITPTGQPLATLGAALAQPPTGGQRWLLVVDQFEELFTLCQDKAERQGFVDRLLATAGLGNPTAAFGTAERPVATVLITLRADFYGDCAEFEPLRAALERWQKYIGPMTPTELRRAIQEPARRNGWVIEADLVELLLRDVGNEPGALPLLAQALLETWNRRRGYTLTVAGYVASGSVPGAIARTAETVYKERLTPSQQPVARQIFLELTEIGEYGQNTRRRLAQSVLFDHCGDKPMVQAVIDTLAQARLVTTTAETVEVSHEALIREWPSLQAWIEADRAALRSHRQLGQAAAEWDQGQRDADLLYRGARLAQVLEYQPSATTKLNGLEQAFVQASLALRNQESAAKERQQQLELTLAQEKAAAAEAQAKTQASRARRLRQVAILLGLLLLIPLTLALLQLRRNLSMWQPVPNFPINPATDLVVTLPISTTALSIVRPKLCVGTSDIGVGCSQDGITWNIYQQNLATGDPAANTNGLFPNTVWGIQKVTFDVYNGQRLFAVVDRNGLYGSEDSGLTWQQLQPGLAPGLEGRGLAVAGQLVFVTTSGEDYGLYVRRDAGRNWEKLNGPGSPLPRQVFAIEIDALNHKLYVGGQGGLYSTPLSPPWQWQQAGAFAAVEALAPVLREPGAYYLATYDEAERSSAIYHLQPGVALKVAQPLVRLSKRVMVVAPHPNPNSRIATYALVCNHIAILCNVVAVTQTGEVETLGNRPLWWPPISYDLLATPGLQGNDVWLLLGHPDGLMIYQGNK